MHYCIREIPGSGPAAAGQLQAAALSVRVFYQSVCQHRSLLHLSTTPTYAINQTVPHCCYQSYNFSAEEHEPKRLIISTTTKQQIALETVPDL